MSTYEELVERVEDSLPEIAWKVSGWLPTANYLTVRVDAADRKRIIAAALDAAGVPDLLAVYEAVLWERNLQEGWEATVDPETTPPLNRYGDPMDCDAWEHEFGAAEKALVTALEAVRGQQ